MAQIEFSFKECLQEIDAITAMTTEFLEPHAIRILQDYRGSLRRIQEAHSETTFRWEITENRPIQTRVTKGYEPGGKGKFDVFAEISSVWEIAARRPAGKKRQEWPRFALVGVASTHIALRRVLGDSETDEVAMWRIEVGDDQGPGCHFHIQVRGREEDPPFPKFLSIPRLPAFPLTAAAALEYTIGELFQDEWKVQGLQENTNSQLWRVIQSARLERFLGWQRDEVVREKATGSPWVRLKTLRPGARLFCPAE